MLDKSTDAKPLWSQVYSIILNRIELEVYEVNNALPTDIDFMNEFSVSRATVRTAMNRLITEGYIRRERGVGSTVIERKDNVATFLRSSFSDVAEHDRKRDRVILSIERVLVPSEVTDYFNVPESTKLVHIVRMTKADGKILSIHQSYLNPQIELIEETDMGDSLYNFLSTQGYPITRVSEKITASVMSEKEKADFGINGESALIIRNRKAYSKKIPVEYNVSSYLSDGYELTIELD